MNLEDILSLDRWLELEKEIFEKSGLSSNVFNYEGVRITDYKVWVNRLCPAIKADDRGQSFICAVAHMNMAGMSRERGEPVTGECDAGFIKLVFPVIVKGEFLGAVGACGLLPEDGDVDAFMVNRTIEMEYDRIERLSHDVKKLTEDEVKILGRYIAGRIKEIVDDYEQNN